MGVKKEIIDTLLESEMTLADLARKFSTTQKEIDICLHEIADAVRPQLALRMKEARCPGCEYTFKEKADRQQTKRPNRCPRCGNECVMPPTFWIERNLSNIPKEWRATNQWD